MIFFHRDCRRFRGDRPCAPHKREGVRCEGCPYYDLIRVRILVVKLDAIGDVLRTTCILPGLRRKYPGAWIDWLTRSGSAPLFYNHPLVDRVLSLGGEAVGTVQASTYDVVVNLDTSPVSAGLGNLARGKERIGFGLSPEGHAYPWNEEAWAWYEMGLLDDVKKANTATYQQIVAGICGIGNDDLSIHLYLSEEEKKRAGMLAKGWGLVPGVPVIGLNTGAGSRWEHKKWTEKAYIELIRLLRASAREGLPVPKVLLLGGREERERNERILAASGGAAIHAGTGHTLREFSAIVGLCDVVVTGDTMALHIAVALGKKVVALFGPTSAAEIDLYGRGVKIVADIPCLNCYRPTCDVRPTCMERISPETVLSAVWELM